MKHHPRDGNERVWIEQFNQIWIVNEMSSTTHIPLQQQDALIGFGDLPTRIYRKISKSVFEFTIMVVGKGPSMRKIPHPSFARR